MLETRKPIPVQETVDRISQYIKGLGTIEVDLEDSDGYILAESIIADHDVPPFDRSPFDGFAILASDTESATREQPISLKVIEKIGAGDVAKTSVTTGTAVRIMTGAILPEGAEAIVKLELTRENGDNVLINRPFQSGDHLSLQGEDAKGQTMIFYFR